jgi:hypothetical protein
LERMMDKIVSGHMSTQKLCHVSNSTSWEWPCQQSAGTDLATQE